MLGDIKGYCTLKPDANPKGCIPHSTLKDHQWFRILDISVDSEDSPNKSFLIINNEGTAISTVNRVECERWFYCTSFGDVLMPPELKDNEVAKIAYHMKVTMRKGGYNNILRNMVILTSLNKNQFCDDFLFSKQ